MFGGTPTTEIELKLSPNPTNELLKIQYLKRGISILKPMFEIINILVMSILTYNLENDSYQIYTKEINVKDLTIGMYFVRIIDGEKVLVKRFIRGE